MTRPARGDSTPFGAEFLESIEIRARGGSFFIGGNFQDTTDAPEFYARSMVIGVPSAG